MEQGGPMYTFLVWAIGSFFTVFVLLVLVILAMKSRRQWQESRWRTRRAQLEPALFKYVAGREPLETYTGGALDASDRPIVEQIFFDLSRIVSGHVIDRAHQAFEQLGFVDYYIRRLDSHRWWTRAEAAEKLGLMGSRRAIPPLVAKMDDLIPDVRVRVARALGSIGSPEAVRPLVHALRAPGRWSAIRVSGILIAAGNEAVQALLEEFYALPMHAQLSAIDIFARIRSLDTVGLLRDLLRHEQPDLRARAAFALGTIGDPGSLDLLTGALRDRAWAVRAMAAKALGRIRDESCIPALCGALADTEWWVRANAAEALKSKGERGTQALLSMLDAQDIYAAQQAVQMLQEAGVLDTLVSQLGSQEAGRRQEALEVMAKLVRLRRTDLLTEMAHNHPESSIRQRLSILLGLRLSPEPVA